MSSTTWTATADGGAKSDLGTLSRYVGGVPQKHWVFFACAGRVYDLFPRGGRPVTLEDAKGRAAAIVKGRAL